MRVEPSRASIHPALSVKALPPYPVTCCHGDDTQAELAADTMADDKSESVSLYFQRMVNLVSVLVVLKVEISSVAERDI